MSGSADSEAVSLWSDAWARLRRNRLAVVSAWFVGLVVVSCTIGPVILHSVLGYTYDAQDLAYGAQGPSLLHPFGTDFHGRDLLTRTLYGGRISLLVGLLAAVVAALIGTLYGAVSGYVGGRLDNAMMRLVDVLYALPYMFLVIILVTIFGKSLWLLFISLGLVSWLTTARIVRGQVLSLREREFIQAAIATGASNRVILFRHLIPNTLGPIVVYFTLTVPAMILQEAFLSFLGLGVQAPAPSLGALINEGAKNMIVFWWQLMFPCAVMTLLLFALNFLGDGLRDALDPKMEQR